MLLGRETGKTVYARAGCPASDLSYAGTAGYALDEESPPHGVLRQSDFLMQGNCDETRIHDDYTEENVA